MPGLELTSAAGSWCELVRCAGGRFESVAERLLKEVLEWPKNPSTEEQADDITVVVIDIGGTSNADDPDIHQTPRWE